jgi:hypothetical protein
MIEEQADKIIELMQRNVVALESAANSAAIIADRLARLVQIEEKRWGTTPTGVWNARLAKENTDQH